MKKTFLFVGAMVVSGIILAGCNSAEKEAKPIYDLKCAVCHGVNLEGVGTNVELKGVGSKLTYDEIFEINKNGKGIMKGGLISEDENKKISKWLSEQK